MGPRESDLCYIIQPSKFPICNLRRRKAAGFRLLKEDGRAAAPPNTASHAAIGTASNAHTLSCLAFFSQSSATSGATRSKRRSSYPLYEALTRFTFRLPSFHLHLTHHFKVLSLPLWHSRAGRLCTIALVLVVFKLPSASNHPKIKPSETPFLGS